MVSEGDKGVTRYKSTGTHRGTFEGDLSWNEFTQK